MDITKTLGDFIDQRIKEYFIQNPIIQDHKPVTLTDKYLTRAEAAQYAKYHVGTIDRFSREGKLTKLYPFGSRSVRYDREEIDRNILSFKNRR